MSIWGIHNTAIAHGELLGDGSTGFVTVGFDSTPDLQACEASPEAFAEMVAGACPTGGPELITGRADQLYCFVHAMAPGDVVIAPDAATRTLSFGRVAGPYYYEAEAPDNHHRVAVRWRRTGVARSVFSRGLLDEIDSRSTFFQVTRSTPEVEAFLSAPTQEAFTARNRDQGPREAGEDREAQEGPWEPAAAHRGFPDAARIEQRTHDAVADRLVHSINRADFIELVADLLGAMGYRTRRAHCPGQGGGDLLAHRDALGLERATIRVRCRHTNIAVSRSEVQDLVDRLAEGESGLMVSLGSYANQALALEGQHRGLRLLGGADVTDLFLTHYDQLPVRWRSLVRLRPVLALETEDAGA